MSYTPELTRTTADLLLSLLQLQTEQLAALQHIQHALDTPSESRSSATVKTSARGTDLEVHSYNDGVLPGAVNEAIREYARGQRMLAELQANQWEQTPEMIARGMNDAN